MHQSTRREFMNRSVSLAGVGAVALVTGRSPGVHAADADAAATVGAHLAHGQDHKQAFGA